MTLYMPISLKRWHGLTSVDALSAIAAEDVRSQHTQGAKVARPIRDCSLAEARTEAKLLLAQKTIGHSSERRVWPWKVGHNKEAMRLRGTISAAHREMGTAMFQIRHRDELSFRCIYEIGNRIIPDFGYVCEGSLCCSQECCVRDLTDESRGCHACNKQMRSLWSAIRHDQIPVVDPAVLPPRLLRNCRLTTRSRPHLLEEASRGPQ
jgi:hypothetical protein